MCFFNKIKSIPIDLPLRLGLGATFIYAGTSIIRAPNSWLGYAPEWIGYLLPLKDFLFIHGVFELILGLFVLFGFYISWVSFLGFFDIALILVFSGVDVVTFRDFGVLGALAALFIINLKRK